MLPSGCCEALNCKHNGACLIGMQQLMCEVFVYHVKYTPWRTTYKQVSKFTNFVYGRFFLSKHMSSIIISLLKNTLGLLVNNARDRAVKKLRDGDVVDQKIREIIAREIEDVRSKLDALSRKDLLTAIDAFETGISYLYEAVDLLPGAARRGRKREDEAQLKEAVSLPTSSAPVDEIVLATGMRNMEPTEFVGDARRALSDGKERFKMAREKATEAFNNESLSTLDRITAIRYRVMAAILASALEILGTASELSSLSVKSTMKGALPECKQCLRKLHSLPDIENNFKVEVKKGLLNIRGRFKKEDRREIIAAVWQVNRAINDVLQACGENIDICYYPTIDIEDMKIDPRSDHRIAKILKKLDIEHENFIVWSFGEDAEDGQKLQHPTGIAINADGEFIIAENYETFKVFDNSGKFIYKFYPQTPTDGTRANVLAVATDEKYTYVLVLLRGSRTSEVQVFNRDMLRMKFSVQEAKNARKLTVGNGKLLVLTHDMVHVYYLNGRYERSFGREIISDARDIAVGPFEQIFVLDAVLNVCVVFNKDGVKKHEFTVRLGDKWRLHGLALHPLGEYVFLVGVEWSNSHGRSKGTLTVEIYTKDGEFCREIRIHEFEAEPIFFKSFAAISKEGRLAVTSGCLRPDFALIGALVFFL
ncbi:uncharacterized protein [Montipora foliosa]|uniref:uncharacterized protein n=1 Tax=Montipora foliosa TaxID=591990 RepID=UPI0035F184D7